MEDNKLAGIKKGAMMNGGKRIGLLVPSSNVVMEEDFFRNVPSHVSVHSARMFLEDTTVEGESKMLDEFVVPAARDVATARPHVIVFGCTSAGALRGNAYDGELCRSINDQTGVPVISVILSVRRALAKEGLRRVAVITPYIEDLNSKIRKSLEDDGLLVTSIHGMGISENFAISEVSPSEIVAFALDKVNPAEADGLFVSCTNFRAMASLSELRHAFPFPVITSNQVTLEAALKAIPGRNH